MDRLHSIVLGPGMGRGSEARSFFKKTLSLCIKNEKPTVIDAVSVEKCYSVSKLKTLTLFFEGWFIFRLRRRERCKRAQKHYFNAKRR